jgi:single-stranded-DNA-specific exonuclease
MKRKHMRTFPVWDILYDDPYDSLVDVLLAGRGLTLDDLNVGPERLHAPERLKDLEQGVERIDRAIRQREKILVYGDYDADGVTSTALMLDFLEEVGAVFDYMLPDRHRDGYGIKPPAVEAALEKKAGLIVTVDNGVSAFEALEMAQRQGLDVVVVDHHKQLEELPLAHSIINPNRRDCDYPFKGLAGVGVAFKVVQALSQGFMEGTQRRRYLNNLLDLVALGTIADVMPVLDENRVLVRHGLKVMEDTKRPGLRYLKAIAGCADGPLNTTSVGFYLGPRLNVAGRLQTADLALQLLRAQQDNQAAVLADKLDRLNTQRRSLQKTAMLEAEDLVSAEDLENDRIIVLLGETWHLGIIGLLAGRLTEQYRRPAVVCSEEKGDGTYVGSARSIPGYDISVGISACASHLKTYGGHSEAAGFSLDGHAYEAFRAALLDHANAHISEADLQARLQVDLFIRPQDIAHDTLDLLRQLEPFGTGHRFPLFAVRDCQVASCRKIGKDHSHLKIGLTVGGQRCTALWWNKGAVADQLTQGQAMTIAFELEADSFTGNGAVQMVVKDMYCQDGQEENT